MKYLKRLWLFSILLPGVIIYAIVIGAKEIATGSFDSYSWNPFKK